MVNSWRIALLSVTWAGTSFLAITNHCRPHNISDASLATVTVPSPSSSLSSGVTSSPRAVSFRQDNQQHTSHQNTFTLNFTSAFAKQHNSDFMNTVCHCSSTGSLERDFTACSDLVIVNPYLQYFLLPINVLLKEDSPELAFFWSQLITDNEDLMRTLRFKISLMSHDYDQLFLRALAD
jgi:hypothetical protein